MPLIFQCKVCQTPLQADPSQAGQLVKCPTCLTVLKVPQPQSVAPAQTAPSLAGIGSSASAGATTAAPPQPRTFRDPTAPPRFGPSHFGGMGATRGGKRYGFNCGYCSSRLEANE